MKNIIQFTGCSLDMYGSTDDGENRIIFIINADLTKKPVFVVNNVEYLIDSTEMSIIINETDISLDSTIRFQMRCDDCQSEIYRISVPSAISENWAIQQVDNLNFKVSEPVAVDGIPIATTERLGGVVVGKTLNITPDGLLNANQGEAITGITNIRLEEILM